MPSAPESGVRVAHSAMATRWEAVLHGADPARLRAAAEEAFAEVDRAEDLLSAFRPESALARVNGAAGNGWVRADPRLLAFLSRVLALARDTDGAFDPTVGPVVRLWTTAREQGRVPDPASLAAAHADVGWRLVALDADASSVRFLRPGVRLDPGAAGKGFALDAAMEALREAGVENALVHGGTSSVAAMGHAPDGGPWTVALPDPPPGFAWHWPGGQAPRIALRDTTLSVSAVWGRAFESGGRVLGHVVDPSTGQPVGRAWLAAVESPAALEGDVFSTALLVRGQEALRGIPGRHWLVESDGRVVAG